MFIYHYRLYLIGGYNLLHPGDAVMYADLDYTSMQYAMDWLVERRGVEVVTFAIPEPATREAVLDAYAQALDAHPNTRLLLLTHISHRTGLLMPVVEITEMARARGVDVILDAAHSWGQIDFTIPNLNVDFIGFNLHKWIGSPVGAGLLYIKRERVQDIDPYMADQDFPPDDIRARVHTGTSNFATFLAIPDALDFHHRVGPAHKEARLRYLRDLWVDQVRDLENMEILTPDDPAMYAGITSFRIKGRVTREENIQIVTDLAENHGVFTVRRGGVAAGDCVRVTPALYTSEDDVARLVDGLKQGAAAAF